MADISNSSPYAKGVYDSVQGAMGLFSRINKTPTAGGDQSVSPADEYESSMSEEEVIELTSNWKKTYFGYYKDIEASQDDAYAYWLGKQKGTDSVADQIEGGRIVDNRIFNALETFLPIATRANPEPLVTSDNSELGQKLAKDTKDALVHLADKLKYRMKLKGVTRNWALMRLGVIRMEYDYHKDEIDVDVVHSKRMLLDPNGVVDDSGIFTGQWIGERLNFSAKTLTEMFPNKKSLIMGKAKDKKGTQLEVIKWWYCGTDTFFTLDNSVLAKKKNPHWNWDGEDKRIDPDTGEEIVTELKGTNHFPLPMAPYIFLSVFKTGLQPHDDTSLILQNLTLQDQVNKRMKQIDKNVDSQNNGIVVDGRVFDQAQAAEAASGLRRGAAIRTMGDVNTTIKREAAPPLAGDIFRMLETSKAELDSVFGISGATPEGIKKEDSVRGKILTSQMDSSRIGGGITEYIEQVADTGYNWMVQLMMVHYDNEHFINSVGAEEGQEMIALKNSRFTIPLTVTVKEGSLIPKDPLTQRNEAIDLFSAGVIDPLNLFKKLEFPDPAGATNQLILWQMLQKGQIQPQMYLPSFKMAGAPQGMPGGGLPQPPGVGGPAVNPLPEGGNVSPPQQTGGQPPEGVASKQLLNSVPIH
jgi:hypothetical protein